MRIGYLDSAKGIAILLMVLGHALGMCDTLFSVNFIRYIYCFHMPLFFVIYGFLYEPLGKKVSYVIRKRAKSYLIPYFFWGGVYANVGIFEKIKLLTYASHQSIDKSGSVTALWFLPTFFITTMIYAIVLEHLRMKKMSIIAILIFLLIAVLLPKFSEGYPWGINIAFEGVAFMFVGSMMKSFIDKRSNKFLLASAVCVSLILMLSLLNGEVNMSVGMYGNHYVPFLFFAIIGSYSCIVYARVMTSRLSVWTEKLGQCSLGILCIHRPVLWMFREILNKVGLDISVLMSIVIATFAVAIAYCIAKMIQKILPEVV